MNLIVQVPATNGPSFMPGIATLSPSLGQQALLQCLLSREVTLVTVTTSVTSELGPKQQSYLYATGPRSFALFLYPTYTIATSNSHRPQASAVCPSLYTLLYSKVYIVYKR
jgi:hypothetical protein